MTFCALSGQRTRDIKTVGTTCDWLIADFGTINDLIFFGLQNSAKNALAEPGELVVQCQCSPYRGSLETRIIK